MEASERLRRDCVVSPALYEICVGSAIEEWKKEDKIICVLFYIVLIEISRKDTRVSILRLDSIGTSVCLPLFAVIQHLRVTVISRLA
jgi:hypothetical protein